MTDRYAKAGPFVRGFGPEQAPVQVPVVVQPDEDEVSEVIGILRGIEREDVARVIKDLTALQAQMFKQFATGATEVIQGVRSRHVGTVTGVLAAWYGSLRTIARACEEHCEKLSYLGNTSLEKVQHGDVRARFGALQVYLDGEWYWLGALVGGS